MNMKPKRFRFQKKTVLDHRTCRCNKYEFCGSCERTSFPWGRHLRPDLISLPVIEERRCVCGCKI